MSEEGTRAVIPYEELSEIDLDALDHLDLEGLSEHFRGLAERASEGQLREALSMPPGAVEEGHADLVRLYAERKTETAARLRRLRSEP